MKSWGSGGVAPPFMTSTLGLSGQLNASIALHPGKNPRHPLHRMPGEPQIWSGRCVKGKIFPLSVIEFRPASPLLYRLSYPDSHVAVCCKM
jgi:hypothetical protein